MSDQPAFTFRAPRRSMGMKLLLVCGLALLMSIPALFVFALLKDRTNRAETVTTEIGAMVGGPQTFTGPVLAVPYVVPAAKATEAAVQGVHLIFPAKGAATVSLTSEVRRRSLFQTPVYLADLTLKSAFDLNGAGAAAPVGAQLDWSKAELLVGASDARGAQSDVTIQMGGRTIALVPASLLSDIALNMVKDRNTPTGDNLQMFGAVAGVDVRPGAVFEVTARMKFSGAQKLAVVPYAKTTSLAVKGDWPHPSFDGGFLPTHRQIDARGFTADWTVPFIARGVPAEGSSEAFGKLGASALSITFVEPANPYQSVARSLKYALMFVGLVFLAYFLFETMVGKRVHPAQYVLVGLAQIIFYLLLLSIAERTGFDVAFLIAAGATISLISAYAGWVFESRKQGFIALAAFSLLYALIYVLMRLEDFALLVGATASFAAIAAVMYFTRGIDWYGSTAGPTPPPAVQSEEPS